MQEDSETLLSPAAEEECMSVAAVAQLATTKRVHVRGHCRFLQR